MERKTKEEAFEDISSKYRGIRAEDLNEDNPYYSCIICNDKECPSVGTAGTCCPDNIGGLSEEEFVRRYDFKVK